MVIVFAALAMGVPAGLFVLWPLLVRRGPSRPVALDDGVAALEAEKVLALRAIRELELDREAGLLADDDYEELRTRYEGRAAAILRQLDALGPRPSAIAGAARRAAPPHVPWTQRPLVLAGGALAILVFGVVLGVLVVRFTGPAPPEMRAELPGPAAAPPTGEGGSARPIPKAMLEGMLRAAHASLDAGRYPEAIAAYKAVLKRDPQNVDAITHLGVILALAGHADAALEAFDRALAIDSSYPHALWDKARVLYELRQDYAGAIAAWERFVAVAPPGDDREQALSRIGEARARLTGAPAR
ncbi:MAG TPA: tetratricopeptide repeat protein [Methylomirabilota bacterium]|nr:tetratricopeptide repeat protein [Methylomirabilota bacterium]